MKPLTREQYIAQQQATGDPIDPTRLRLAEMRGAEPARIDDDPAAAARWRYIDEGVAAHIASRTLGPRKERLQELCRELLIELGEDPDRPGLADTPRRWADWWLEFVGYQPGTTD